ncbi:MAG: hypothetical protein KatS3mg050_4110 [Litorilinea sp.]|nr:MAG: hypothetical protein KatS3mg050_4110 [Litorilinea sp.]
MKTRWPGEVNEQVDITGFVQRASRARAEERQGADVEMGT